MAKKIFLTGATGYIGGEVLHAISKDYPDLQLTLLVRSEAKAQPILKQYPKARIVYGDLTSSELLEKESADADIVIHTANSADDIPSAEAIARGLAAGHTSEQPGYWIHVSGTAILCQYDTSHGRYGVGPVPENTFNDIDGVERITSIPDDAVHREIDKIVIAANSPAVRVAIVCPSTIYGTGTGPGNKKSVQIPYLARTTLKAGFAPQFGDGNAQWNNVHIHDVGTIFSLLAAKAAEGTSDTEIFGPRAYYFLATGTHRWGDVAVWLAEAATKLKGEKVGVKRVEEKEAAGLGWLVFCAHANSVAVGRRGEEILGWRPVVPETLQETIAKEVEEVAV